MNSQIYDKKIPQGWGVTKLGDIVDFFDNLRIPVAASLRKFGTTPYYGANGIQDYVDGFTHNGEFVLIAEDGANDLINYPVNYVNGKIWVNNHAHVVSGKNKIIDNKFLSYCLKITNFSKFLVGGTRAKLNASILKNIEILLPKDIKEQTKIAQILSDADELINVKCGLLDKKRAIKQAAAQQLLTPKPHWHTATLGEICKYIKTGKLDANAMEENGEFPFFTCAKKVYRINKYNFDLEALLISGNGANVGYIHYYKGKFNAYQRTYVLSDFSCNIFYLKNFLDLKLQERIEKEVRSGNTPYITMDTLVDMWISFPNLSEQTKIAKILSDMDDEISALQDEIEKLKIIKQGAMDELLSGKIRLKG